jgi:hypothetical protein
MAQEILLKAQQAIAKNDFKAAAEAFTCLIDDYKPPNPALLLVSRATCCKFKADPQMT